MGTPLYFMCDYYIQWAENDIYFVLQTRVSLKFNRLFYCLEQYKSELIELFVEGQEEGEKMYVLVAVIVLAILERVHV